MPNPGPATTVTPNSQNLSSQQAIRLLAIQKACNVNALGDIALPIISATNYSVSNVVMSGATISLTTAAAGLFTAPGAGGTAIVANAALSALTGPTIVSQRTVASTTNRTEQTLYLNTATAQGAAATVDVYVYGYDLS